MNIPNRLTTLRLIITVIQVVLYCVFKDTTWIMFVVAGLFIIGSLTDFLDGKIARKYHLVTGFGKLMDPIADKLLVISCIMILVDNKTIPYWWIALIVVARELFVSGIRLAAIEGDGNVIAADRFGKLKTLTQMTSLSVLLVLAGLKSFIVSQWIDYLILAFLILFYISVVLCVASGISYFIKNRHYFKMK